MISPIELTPNMDSATLTAALNDFSRQVENENRTKIVVDESGVSRIILGKMPDGTYGLLITKPTFDAVKLFS